MRKTMKVEVEVTIETEHPQDHTSAELADELRDRVFEIVGNDDAYDVVVMTVTGVDA